MFLHDRAHRPEASRDTAPAAPEMDGGSNAFIQSLIAEACSEPGEPLDPCWVSEFCAATGVSEGSYLPVLVHTGPTAGRAVSALNTCALTYGTHVLSDGPLRRDVALHEMAHLARGDSAGAADFASPGEEAEADRLAGRVMRGEDAPIPAGGVPEGDADGTVACWGGTGGEEEWAGTGGEYGGVGGVEPDWERGGGTTGGHEENPDAAYAAHVEEREAFKGLFELWTFSIAAKMLDDAELLIRDELDRYGYGPLDASTTAVEVEGLVAAAGQMYDALAVLREHERKLESFPTLGNAYPERHVDGAADGSDPADPSQDSWTGLVEGMDEAELEQRCLDLDAEYRSVSSAACAAYPVLAMFKEGRQHDQDSLWSIANEDRGSALFIVADGCNERLDAIDEVRTNFEENAADGDLDFIYGLPRVMSMAAKEMDCSETERADIKVWTHDAKSHQALVDVFWGLVEIGAILAATAINPYLGAATAAGLSTVFASKAWEDASLEEAKSLTALDKADAIAIGHPEWHWVALEIAFVFTDVYVAAKLFNQLVPDLARWFGRGGGRHAALSNIASNPKVPRSLVEEVVLRDFDTLPIDREEITKWAASLSESDAKAYLDLHKKMLPDIEDEVAFFAAQRRTKALNRRPKVAAVDEAAVAAGSGTGLADEVAAMSDDQVRRELDTVREQLADYGDKTLDEITALGKRRDELVTAARERGVEEVPARDSRAVSGEIVVDGPTASRTKPGAGTEVGARTMDAKALPRPPGMSIAEFGKVIGWTKGGTREANLEATKSLIAGLPGRVDELRAAGVTSDMADAWARFYAQEAERVQRNPNAYARSQLMRAIAELLR